MRMMEIAEQFGNLPEYTSTFIRVVAIVRISLSQDFLPILKVKSSTAALLTRDSMSSSEKAKETQGIEDGDEPDEW